MIKIKLIDSRWDPNPGDYKSMIVLNYDEWNDFGYRTSFGMFFCDANGLVQKIGEVKIYYWENEIGRKNSYNDHTRSSMEVDIVSLSDAYCSLGQDLKYYKTLKTLFPREYRDILRRLNDIAIFEDIRDRFINESGVKTSLLRFSSAQKALNEAKKVVVDELEEKKDISFKYHIKMPYDETPVDLDFNFKQTQDIPYRINIIIGKNGAGKTQLLSRLANSLSGYTDEKEMDCFLGGRPPIDKVMSISYSAFDSFKKPNGEKMNQRSVFSYVYCGIQSDKGTLSLDDLKHNLKIAYAMVKEKNRKEEWIEVLSELMEEEHRKTVDSIIAERFEEVNLSSGQQILICTMTELIANIENESIILFDEPEIHLHPNAISNVMRMFYSLLEKFNSYAIFTTHSPIILQEIPSQYIQILERIDNIPYVRKPDVECFGNNISDIIFDVFDVKGRESNYKTIIDKLSKYRSKEEIRQLFNNQLSLNALIYLENCYNEEV